MQKNSWQQKHKTHCKKKKTLKKKHTKKITKKNIRKHTKPLEKLQKQKRNPFEKNFGKKTCKKNFKKKSVLKKENRMKRNPSEFFSKKLYFGSSQFCSESHVCLTCVHFVKVCLSPIRNGFKITELDGWSNSQSDERAPVTDPTVRGFAAHPRDSCEKTSLFCRNHCDPHVPFENEGRKPSHSRKHCMTELPAMEQILVRVSSLL